MRSSTAAQTGATLFLGLFLAGSLLALQPAFPSLRAPHAGGTGDSFEVLQVPSNLGDRLPGGEATERSPGHETAVKPILSLRSAAVPVDGPPRPGAETLQTDGQRPRSQNPVREEVRDSRLRRDRAPSDRRREEQRPTRADEPIDRHHGRRSPGLERRRQDGMTASGSNNGRSNVAPKTRDTHTRPDRRTTQRDDKVRRPERRRAPANSDRTSQRGHAQRAERRRG